MKFRILEVNKGRCRMSAMRHNNPCCHSNRVVYITRPEEMTAKNIYYNSLMTAHNWTTEGENVCWIQGNSCQCMKKNLHGIRCISNFHFEIMFITYIIHILISRCQDVNCSEWQQQTGHGNYNKENKTSIVQVHQSVINLFRISILIFKIFRSIHISHVIMALSFMSRHICVG